MHHLAARRQGLQLHPAAAPGQSLNAAGDIFAWQHDPEPLGNGEYTFFDNESAGAANTGAGATSELGFSRAVRVKLDERTPDGDAGAVL